MEHGHGKMKNAGYLFTRFVKKTYSGNCQTTGVSSGVVIILIVVLLVGIIA
jgi:hypothetical protein